MWSGTLSKGGSVTIADLPKYNVLVLFSNYDGPMLAIRHTKGIEFDALLGGAQDNSIVYNGAKLTANSTKLTLTLAGSMWHHSTTSFTNLTITNIYGLL